MGAGGGTGPSACAVFAAALTRLLESLARGVLRPSLSVWARASVPVKRRRWANSSRKSVRVFAVCSTRDKPVEEFRERTGDSPRDPVCVDI